MSHLDPRTAQCDREVQRITKLTKSYIPTANTLARINIQIGKTAIMVANESSMTHLKRGRPLGSKDLIPRKRKIKGQQNLSLDENSCKTPENLKFSKSRKK